MSQYAVISTQSQIVFRNTGNNFFWLTFFEATGQGIAISNWANGAFLHLEALGGPPGPQGGVAHIDLRFILNGRDLGTFQFGRWTDHFTIIPTTKIIFIPLGVLRVQWAFQPPIYNQLTVQSADPNDFFFIGPIVCHF